ncbi:MAG TPA: TolC family protein [Polyangiaceae bacterium]|nr:TolC family protein [Polyangiaceae bacterium]
MKRDRSPFCNPIRPACIAAFVFATRSSFAEPAPAPVVDDAPGSAELLARLRERVAQPGGLTSAEAGRRAVLTSPEDRSRKADVEAAASEIDRADVGYYPKLTLTARYTRLSAITPPAVGPLLAPVVAPNQPPPTPGTIVTNGVVGSFAFPVVLDNYMLQANVVVPLSDYFLRIGQTREAAVSNEQASAITREAARRSVATQAKLAYYTWARDRMQEAVTEQSVEQARWHLELARAGRDAGRTPDVDVVRAESSLAGAELLHQRTANAARVAEERLRTLLHDASGAPYRIGEDLLAPLPKPVVEAPAVLYAEALGKRPEMRAFEKSEASLRAERTATESTGLPRLDAFGNGYVANPSPRIFPQREEWKATWDVGVQLTWSPNDLGGADASTRSIDAKRRQLDAERAAVKDALRDEISAAVVATEEAVEEAESADRGLSAAEESYRVRRELFALGRATQVELVDAETDVLRARLEMIQARVDGRVARVQLDHAVGRDVSR